MSCHVDGVCMVDTTLQWTFILGISATSLYIAEVLLVKPSRECNPIEIDFN